MINNNLFGIDDIRITPRNYAEDYFEGEQRYRRHIEYLQLARQGVSPNEYAHSLGFTRSGNPTEYNTAHLAFSNWLRGNYSHAIKGLIELHRLGIFQASGIEPDADYYFDPEKLTDFTTNSRYFEFLSLLASITYCTGCTRMNGNTANNTTKNLTLVHRDMPDSESQKLIARLIEQLKQRGFCTNQDTNNPAYHNAEGHLTGAVSRLIGLMSYMIGKKKDVDPDLPIVVKAALKTINETADKRQPEASRIMAYGVIRDFALSFLLFRCKYTHTNGYAGFQPSHKDKQVAESRGKTFLELMEKSDLLFLQPEFKPIKSPLANGEKTYKALIKFRKMRPHHLQRIQFEMQSRIDQVLAKK